MTTFSPDELEAIGIALRGMEEEYGLYVEMPHHDDLDKLDHETRKATVDAAYAAGKALIEKVEDLADSGKEVRVL